MINGAANNQQKLLTIINALFSFTTNPYTQKKQVRINPELTEEKLQGIIEKTRKLIIDLYVKCENDYVTGVKLYEAIVESKILSTTEKQIDNLKKEASKIIEESKNVGVAKDINAPLKQNTENEIR